MHLTIPFLHDTYRHFAEEFADWCPPGFSLALGRKRIALLDFACLMEDLSDKQILLGCMAAGDLPAVSNRTVALHPVNLYPMAMEAVPEQPPVSRYDRLASPTAPTLPGVVFTDVGRTFEDAVAELEHGWADRYRRQRVNTPIAIQAKCLLCVVGATLAASASLSSHWLQGLLYEDPGDFLRLFPMGHAWAAYLGWDRSRGRGVTVAAATSEHVQNRPSWPWLEPEGHPTRYARLLDGGTNVEAAAT